MIHADTEGLLDKCHCGAVAGFEHLEGFYLRARCTECCEQTGSDHHVHPVVVEWNLARRAEKEKAVDVWVAMIPRTDETTCRTCNGYGGLRHRDKIDPTDGGPITIQCPDCRAEDDMV